jgi:ribonuclease HI
MFTDDPAVAIFSLTIPNAPTHAWDQIQAVLPENDVRADLQDYIFPMSSLLWRYMCGATLAAIWRQRNQLLNDGATSIPAQQAISDAYISKGMTNLRLLMESNVRTDDDVLASTVLRGFVSILNHDSRPQVERCLPTDGQFLLFFDGGSRGNPGPGGSGSVLLKIDSTTREARIVWVASMAYGNPSMTNNVAEYWGLIHGLRYAHSHRCVPLHVVGDSAMIIRQQKLHHPPKKSNLARLHHQSKRVADTMTILSWSHHYRANNKMADLAANHAMDSATSTQYPFPTACSS